MKVNIISAETAKDLCQNADTCIIDIRDEEAFKTEHIKNASHLSNDNMEDFIRNTDRETPIILYCYRGKSSENTAKYLCEQGFKNVYSVEGGFGNWRSICPELCC